MLPVRLSLGPSFRKIHAIRYNIIGSMTTMENEMVVLTDGWWILRLKDFDSGKGC